MDIKAPEFITSEDLTQLMELSSKVTALEVKDNEHAATAQQLRTSIRKLRTMVGKRKKEAKEPILKAGKAIELQGKVVLQPLEELLGLLDNKIATYVIKVEEEARRAEEAKEKLERNILTDAPVPVEEIPVAPEVTGIKFRKGTQLEIYDADKLPREFLVPDTAKIRAALLSGTDVAGARIVEIRRLN